MFIMVTAHKKKLRRLMNIILALYPEDIVIPINDSMSSVQFVLHNPVDLIYAAQSAPPIDILATGGMITKFSRLDKIIMNQQTVFSGGSYRSETVWCALTNNL